MATFPRSAGALPRFATPPKFPSGMKNWGASGKGQFRAVKNMGRVWTETYPILDTQNPSVRALVELINRSLRFGLVWSVQHPYWHFSKGVGGGSPLAHSPSQLVVAPENFADASWVNWVGTPTRTAGQGDPFGGSAAYQLTSAADGDSIRATVGFTGNAEKVESLYLRAGTAGATHIYLFDSTTSTTRRAIRVKWSAGVPSLSNIAGSGAMFVPETIAGTTWYRISFSAVGVVAANVNYFIIYPSGNGDGFTGTVFVFGANAWDATVVASYRGPSKLGPYAYSKSQEGSLLYVRNAPVSTVAWLRQGDMIATAPAPVVLDVTAQVDTDVNGGAIIPVSPQIFATSYYVQDGTAITVDPTQVMFTAVIEQVQAPPAMDSSAYIDAGLTLTWREVAG